MKKFCRFYVPIEIKQVFLIFPSFFYVIKYCALNYMTLSLCISYLVNTLCRELSVLMKSSIASLAWSWCINIRLFNCAWFSNEIMPCFFIYNLITICILDVLTNFLLRYLFHKINKKPSLFRYFNLIFFRSSHQLVRAINNHISYTNVIYVTDEIR